MVSYAELLTLLLGSSKLVITDPNCLHTDQSDHWKTSVFNLQDPERDKRCEKIHLNCYNLILTKQRLCCVSEHNTWQCQTKASDVSYQKIIHTLFNISHDSK